MAVKDTISALLNEVKDAYKKEQIDKGLRSSGKSAASLRIEVKETEGSLYGAKYFFQQKYGRRPGKFPPIDDILNWIRVKGIQARDKKTTTRQLAFLFARKIAQKGTDIFTGRRKGLELDEKIDEIVKSYTTKIAKEFKDSILTRTR